MDAESPTATQAGALATSSALRDRAAATGRLYIVAAAILWSTSGAFTKLLTQPTWLELNEPRIEPLTLGGRDYPVQLACYRVLFAGLVLLPTLRPGQIVFRPLMLVMLLCFAAMNALFVSALALGTAANAILLQYSAPLWMYLASILWLHEKPDRRSAWSMLLGMAGIAVIVVGGWHQGELLVSAIALASGLFYAGVIVCLRSLRDLAPGWLTVWNHLLGGVLLLPLALLLRPPTLAQFGVLLLFGALQMGLAYWLMARGLRSVSAQEAGTLTLLEPLLNPVWAYLVSPATEVPHPLTLVGGAIILGALAWRYWPWATCRSA